MSPPATSDHDPTSDAVGCNENQNTVQKEGFKRTPIGMDYPIIIPLEWGLGVLAVDLDLS